MSLLRALPSPLLGEMASSQNQSDEISTGLLSRVKDILPPVVNSALQTHSRYQAGSLGEVIARAQRVESGLLRNIGGLEALQKKLVSSNAILQRQMAGVEKTRASFPKLTESVLRTLSRSKQKVLAKSTSVASTLADQQDELLRLARSVEALKAEQAKWSPSKSVTRGVGLALIIGGGLTIYNNEQRVKNGEISREEALTDDAVTVTGVYLPSALLASAAQGLYYAKIGSRAGFKGALIGFAIGFGVELAAIYGFSEAKDYFESAGCRVTDVMVSALEFTVGYTDDEGVKHKPAVDAVVHTLEWFTGYTDDYGVTRGMFRDPALLMSVKNFVNKVQPGTFE